MENLLYILWLHLLPGIGPYLIKNLLTTFGNATTIYHAPIDALITVPGIGIKLAHTITTSKQTSQANTLLEYCLSEEIQLISCHHPLYPSRLLEHPKSPTLLYVKGNLSLLNTQPSAAIVGARRCSSYGKEATTELSAYLTSQSISILSGMAKGTDSYAHTTAIKNNGYTLAVVGTGLDRCYPSEHLSLMERIIETGAVISQFPPFTTVHKQNFIRRNELIAMLSDQVYVMQATKNSGALYTAQCATTFNKQVYSLPGSIYDSLSEGSNQLIATGASIYLPSQLKPTADSKESSTHYSSPQAQALCTLITHVPLTFDEIATQLNIDLSSLHELIFQLEIEGKIHQTGGLIHLTSISKGQIL